MKIVGIFRHDQSVYDPNKKPGKGNSGGGVSVKIAAMRKIIPNIHITSELSEAGEINIICPLVFDIASNPFNALIDQYKAISGLKILLSSDVSLLRITGEERNAILDATDVVACDSDYLVNLLKPIIPNAVVLTEPVDTDAIIPLPKDDFIFSMSQLTIYKNIDLIIDVFTKLAGSPIKTKFIGGVDTWGSIVNDGDLNLQKNLRSVTDVHIMNANRDEVAQHVGSAWGYISDTKYDTMCFSLAEAMCAGCQCFCGTHPLYDDREGLFRFETADEAVDLIRKTYEHKDHFGINEEARQYVIDNFSFSVFKRQLTEIIGKGGLNA